MSDLIEFLRNYDFAFAGAVTWCNVEKLRATLMSAVAESWNARRTEKELISAGACADPISAKVLAHMETMRAANGALVISYRRAKIDKKVWIADSGACERCRALVAQPIPIDDSFVPDAELLHPPAHVGCRCAIAADIS